MGSMVLLVLLILTFGYGRDQGIYAVVARTVLEGGMPYRDAFDFKPPGIYLVYAFSRALFGNAWWGVRLLEGIGAAATVYGLVTLSRRWWGEWRIGLVGGALYLLVHAQLDFWHTAQPETFGGMLTVAGLVIGATRPRRQGGAFPLWRLVFAGVVFGCAGLLKPPLAGAGAVLAFWHAIPLAREKRFKHALRPLLLVLVGGVIPFALCLAWFAAKGALDALHETLFVFTPHYTKLGWKDRHVFGLLYQAFAQWLVSFCSLMSVGLLIGLAAHRQAYKGRREVILLLGIIAMQLLGVALQGKFFPYHYAACWPVTGLVAGVAWWHLWTKAIRRGKLAVAAFASFFVVAASLRTATKDVSNSFWRRSATRASAFLLGESTLAKGDELASVADVNAAANREVAAELGRRVPVDGYVYIWGFEPVIYDLADRRFASYYIYNVPQRVDWAAPPARRRLLDDLAAHPPDAIVVVHHDVFPMVTGNGIGSSDVLETDFPQLGELMRAYGKVKRIQDFDIYVRR